MTSCFASIACPVAAMVTTKAMSSRAKSGAKMRVSTGAMFSTTRCFASTVRPRRPYPGGAARQDPALQGGHPDADGPEDAGGQRHEDAAAQRDEDVVDEELAGEADKVHPPVAARQPAA